MRSDSWFILTELETVRNYLAATAALVTIPRDWYLLRYKYPVVPVVRGRGSRVPVVVLM